MKTDLNSILYIVIMIVVLVISGLGSRRKKKMQQLQARPFLEDETTETRPSEPIQVRAASATRKVQSPFDRLEEFITGQFPEQMSMEGESLESTEDEEDLILEEIRKSREEEKPSVPEKKQEEKLSELMKSKKEPEPALFGNFSEIKRAIIYSEILKRKYT